MKKFYTVFTYLVISFSNIFSQTTDIYTSGTTTWTVPACVFTVTVKAWGGGGAGGGARATDRNGGGGGGGAYSTVVNYTVSPGQQLTIVVGAGGTGVAGANGNNGAASSVTIVSGPVICLAAGGNGGLMGANSSSSGAGGLGGAIANNIPVGVGFSGGRGGNSNPVTTSTDQSGAGGGGAGTSANGANGANNGGAGGAGGATGGGAGGNGLSTTTNAGSPGNIGNNLGGGGGGATCFNTGTRAGGNGGRGQIEITYTVGPCCPPPATPTGITGPNNPCYNTTQSYSVTSAGATNFIWDVPAGWTILSGLGTSSISVTVGIGGGNVSVQPENACSTLPPTLLPVTVCAASVPAPNQIYSIPGTYSWTVPPCVTNVIVQAWGGGGGGGGIASFGVSCGICSYVEACSAGGGGGGGGFVSRTYNVNPGEVYTIVVGAGGTGGPNSNSATATARDGGNGNNSTFSGPATLVPGTLTAVGGNGGNGARTVHSGSTPDHQGNNGIPGTGGSGLNGTLTYTGGTGAVGMHSASCWDLSGGGGGGAGNTANGGVAQTLVCFGGQAGGTGGSSGGGTGGNGRADTGISTQSFDGFTGNAIGGGGGGALVHLRDWLNSWITRTGGTGARGEVRLTFIDCLLPVNILNFSGYALQNTNKLSWEIDAIQDLNSFILEKSVDGTHWFVVNEHVEKISDNQFSLVDHHCLNDEISYYRLSAIENSGNQNKFNSVVEIYRNIHQIEVLKIVNLLGQEVTEDYSGIVFKYLKNGQIERCLQN